MENSSTSVIVKLELGHQAFLRSHPTQDGFTHDWTVFVRGIEGSNIHHFIEKVVFYLHESFPKPKRVVKEPPYQVSESGYAGFIMPIEVYFRNKEEPKKVKFEYDLYLRLEGPPVNHVRYEKLTFQNPVDDFRRKLLKAGGMIIQKFTKANYNKRGRPNINSSTVVLLGLWTLGNQETFWQISDQFDVSQSSCHSLFRYFCKMLVNWIPVYIQWLKPDKFKDTAEKFEKIADFPGFIGAIDGCHINIKKPSVDGESYFNRKKAYSIVLMATVDNSMTFTDINIGWPSSVHDARVFRNSDLYKNLNENNFPNNYHLIEDAAFPLLPTLLVPYRDNGHLTPKQIHFNKALSKTRIIVERAFGLLKGKFRCLKYLDINCMENIKYIVNAACVLHNIYIGTKDWMEEEIELDLTDIDLQEDNSSKPFGTDKRNYIADMLM